MLEIGSVIGGKYKILNLVGRGGMSNVYLAMNEVANRQWAIKEVRYDVIYNYRIVRQSLVRELELLKQLRHPCLPSIVDVIEKEDSFLIVMDYVEGHTMEQVMSERGALPQKEVVEWGIQLCQVLGYLHSRSPGIIYRDMKPSNIMLRPDGTIALIDFGTAREYKTDQDTDTVCMGTLGYAAPEQMISDEQTDERTDIYSLGVTLYALLTGWDATSMNGIFDPIRTIRPEISPGLEKVLSRAMCRKPKERFSSAAELEYALRHYKELERTYQVGQWRILLRFCACVTAAVLCFALSSGAECRAQDILSEDYERALDSAKEDGDYEKAIAVDPGRTEAYETLAASMQSDYLLTRKEHERLKSLLAGVEYQDEDGYSRVDDVLLILQEKNTEGYVQVCNRFGQLELFYADGLSTKERYANGAVWFSMIRQQDEEADVFCSISELLNEIDAYRNSKLPQTEAVCLSYDKLWHQLECLQMSARTQEDGDLQIQIWSEIQEVVDDHAVNLVYVVGKDPVTQLLREVLASIRSETEDYEKSNMLAERMQTLRQSCEETLSKVESIREK